MAVSELTLRKLEGVTRVAFFGAGGFMICLCCIAMIVTVYTDDFQASMERGRIFAKLVVPLLPIFFVFGVLNVFIKNKLGE